MEKIERSVAEKRALGQQYFDELSNYHIEGYLEAVWKVLFYSASLHEYPKDTSHSLKAIDMLIEEAEKRIGHSVEPAPRSTFIYGEGRKKPQFAAREAKIYALLKEMNGYSSPKIECFRQGKGYYYSDGDRERTEYMRLGERGSYPFEHLTICSIEKVIQDNFSSYDLHGDGIKAIYPFVCSGEYSEDISPLLKTRNIQKTAELVANSGLDVLGKKGKEELIKNVRSNPAVPAFVGENIEKLLDPQNRKAIELLLGALRDAQKDGNVCSIRDLFPVNQKYRVR